MHRGASGAKARVIANALRGAEAPLFHGTAHDSSADNFVCSRNAVKQLTLVDFLVK